MRGTELIPQDCSFPFNYGFWPMITHESPETAVARQIPERLLNLLEEESKRKRYNEAIAIGSEVVKTHLERLLPEDNKKIKEISVVPYAKIGGFLGLGANMGMVISFKRYENL